MAPALRMRAIGGAAVVLLAIRLAPFAYAKTARLATLRIVQRAVGSQASATPEHIVWESQRLYDEARYACAAEHLARAVDMRSPYAHALLSTLLVEGRPGLPRDHARAFRLAAAGAELGCVHSKGALGRCFSGGFGVAQDALQAHALAEHSAASGSRFGMFVLAVCYEHGEGVGVDMEMAISLWRRAADQRHASAQYNLGVALKRGNNPAEAVCCLGPPLGRYATFVPLGVVPAAVKSCTHNSQRGPCANPSAVLKQTSRAALIASAGMCAMCRGAAQPRHPQAARCPCSEWGLYFSFRTRLRQGVRWQAQHT